MELSSAELLPNLVGEFEKYFGFVGGKMYDRSIGILTDWVNKYNDRNVRSM